MTNARKDYQKKDWRKGSNIDKMSEEDKKAHFVYFNAFLCVLIEGRKINDDNKNDIDNW